MSFFKRISSSIYAQIDGMVGEIENHDALIKAAITEQRKKLAAAKVQLNRIKANESKLERQIAELKQNEQRWRERAVKSAAEDENQALACLQRRQAIETQIEQLNSTRSAYQQTAAKMTQDIQRCETELKNMSQKHEIMRAKQSSIEAQSTFNEVNGGSIDELETSFERWEVKLAQGEMNIETTDPLDTLEQTFVDEENAAALRAELAELMEKENNND